MNKFKYTLDGKKVVVIGDLNQTEKIVQEVFVTEDGAEIPSGERFVAKSLLDQPAKSWKEKNLIELESNYEKSRKEWERKIKILDQEKSFVYDSLSARVKWLKQVAKEPQPGSLKKAVNVLASFLSNEEKWMFYDQYGDYKFVTFDEDGSNSLLDSLDSYSRVRFDGMRLISIYGDSKGDFEYRVNTYGDGSGSDTKVVFFQSKEEGLEFMQERLDSVIKYNSSHLNSAEKHGLKLDVTKLNVYNKVIIDSMEEDIKNTEKNLKDKKDKLHLLKDRF